MEAYTCGAATCVVHQVGQVSTRARGPRRAAPSGNIGRPLSQTTYLCVAFQELVRDFPMSQLSSVINTGECRTNPLPSCLANGRPSRRAVKRLHRPASLPMLSPC